MMITIVTLFDEEMAIPFAAAHEGEIGPARRQQIAEQLNARLGGPDDEDGGEGRTVYFHESRTFALGEEIEVVSCYGPNDE